MTNGKRRRGRPDGSLRRGGAQRLARRMRTAMRYVSAVAAAARFAGDEDVLGDAVAAHALLEDLEERLSRRPETWATRPGPQKEGR